MTWRRQPPVVSPVTAGALIDGIVAAIGFRASAHDALRRELRERHGCVDAVLTDSGTSALILALRKIVPAGGTVAYPAYSCIDLTTAALGAQVRVRLYDLDPTTLSPDLDSVRAAIARGVDAIVVAHLYGYPADMMGIRDLAEEYGIPVIEDAAQSAGGTLHGVPLGGFGDITIRSFGRGKGTTGGAGGAILVRHQALAEWTASLRFDLPAGSHGIKEILALAGQRALSHPSLYRLPSSIPSLRLGEMVYQQPWAPAGMSSASAAILLSTLQLETREAVARGERASDILSRLHGRSVMPIHPVFGGQSGFLRLPVIDTDDARTPRADLGAVRGYPLTLDQHPQLQPLLAPGERAGKGSQLLRDRLFTLPTHAFVRQTDLVRLTEWLGDRELGPRVLATAM